MSGAKGASSNDSVVLHLSKNNVRSRKIFNDTFTKWSSKKLVKKPAVGVVVEDLIKVSGIRWK